MCVCVCVAKQERLGTADVTYEQLRDGVGQRARVCCRMGWVFYGFMWVPVFQT